MGVLEVEAAGGGWFRGGSHDRRIGHSGFSLITNERMRWFWAEFNEGRYMETRHAWNKEWSKDIMEM